MPGKENEVIREALDMLIRNGIFAWRQNTTGGYKADFKCYRGFVRGPWTMLDGKAVNVKGLPDIIAVLPGGKFLGLEAKAKGYRISEDQENVRDAIRRLNGLYCVFNKNEDIIEFLMEQEGMVLD